MQSASGGSDSSCTLLRKATLFLKLSVFFMLAATVPICTPALTQRVSIVGDKLSLEQVFTEISKQTGLEFFYETAVLKAAPPVSVDVHDMPVEEVLKWCLQGQRLSFTVRSGTIIIFKESNPAQIEEPKMHKEH